MDHTLPKYPVFVMCGRDAKRRKLMEVHDPEGKYKAKALLPFLGKHLIDWQIEELHKSPYVAEIYLLGLSEADITFDFPVQYVAVETNSSVADKLSAGLAFLTGKGIDPRMIVISSSDTPGIRQQEIDTFIQQLEQMKKVDYVQSLVPEAVGEVEFPRCGRAVARFRDHQVFPGELFAISPRAITIANQAIREINDQRRKINRYAKKISIGPMISFIAKRPRTWLFIVKYALKLATLEDAEKALTAAFGIKIKGLIIPDAGFGMDMDLPEDYARLEEFVRRTKMV